MDRAGLRLTQPGERIFEEFITQFEQEYGFSDNLIYKGCLDAVRKIELSEINEQHIKGPIYTFLLNWGMMGRVLGGKTDWKSRLKEQIDRSSSLLTDFRQRDLAEIEVEPFEEEIKKCYVFLKEAVKMTSASMALHLICPDFFPMWDVAIREKISEEMTKRGERRMGDSGKDYYRFVVEMKNIILEYHGILSRLTREYSKGKLKLLDEYLWWATHPQGKV